jgi:long-chain fatty acid transport protein
LTIGFKGEVMRSHGCGWVAATVLAFGIGVPGAAFAQVNVEAMQGVQFDFLAPGARSLAMGGAFVAVADDATAALSNPAGLSSLTRREVSIEGRFRQFKVPFVLAGRLSGTPTGTGIDTVANPTFDEASSDESGLSFLSFVLASPDRPWTLAAYRHETVRYSTAITTQGAFRRNEEGGTNRFFPVIGDLGLDIVNYGVAGSWKWQVCNDVSGARVCEDRFAIGGGLSMYQFNAESLTTRFDLNDDGVGVGDFFGPPQYTTLVNQQTLDGDETGFGVNVGMIFKPNRYLQLGLSHRRGATFDFTASNSGPSFDAYTRDAEFAMPHVTTAGLALRLGGSSIVAVDYSRVQYSRLAERFVDVFFEPGVDDPSLDRAADFTAPDGNEFHLGFEHQFLNFGATPAIRFGTWFDPAHAVTSSVERNAIFRPGEDVWHFTAGGGFVAGPAEISFAGDFSDRGNIGSASLVFRF